MLKRFQLLLFVGTILSVLSLSTGGCNSLPNALLLWGKKDKELPSDTFETEIEGGKPKLVGDCANIDYHYPVLVRGFGLVVGLPGTGGDDSNTTHHQWVYDDMKKQKISGINAILARPDTAVVEVIGKMQPGIQKGDRFDVQVTLPRDTNTKSLCGGVLVRTQLAEMATFGGTMEAGTTRAIAEGPIMVDDPMATETSNPSGLKKGTILSGAATSESRYLALMLKEKSIVGADRIAKAINRRFSLSNSWKGIADAQTDELIILDIHPSYVNNVSRYIRVIQSIAFYETPVQQLKRIERLKEELQNPETAMQAAFQLEAIGKPGIEALQQALQNPDREVRFYAATALAYLGDSTPAKELAEITLEERAFRVYALDALSVMKNDLEAEYYLQELLHVPSAEIRYGAFRALEHRNSQDQTVRGELLGGQFKYHGINSHAAPMVHITTHKQPEIVLFGTDTVLHQPFALEAGAAIYVNGQMPGNVVITRFAAAGFGLDEKRTVSNRLDEIIRAVVDLGGTYPDVVQLLRQAEREKRLSCRLENDCLPEANRVYRRSGGDEELASSEEEEKSKSIWERMKPKNIFAPNPGEKSSDYAGTVNASSRD